MPGDTKLQLFTQACDLLGGNKAAAEALGMSDRSLRYLFDGTRPLHTGLLGDISKALLAHADQCRAIERQLSPAFAENSTGLPAPHGHSAHAQRRRLADIEAKAFARPTGGMEPKATLVRSDPSAAGGRDKR